MVVVVVVGAGVVVVVCELLELDELLDEDELDTTADEVVVV